MSNLKSGTMLRLEPQHQQVLCFQMLQVEAPSMHAALLLCSNVIMPDFERGESIVSRSNPAEDVTSTALGG